MPGDDWYIDWYKQIGLKMPKNTSQTQWNKYTSGGVSGILEGAGFKEPGRYSQFITEYNPFAEIIAQKSYDTQMEQFKIQRDTLSKTYSNQLLGLLGETESATAKSGFAESGAINRASGMARGNLGFDYMSGIRGINLGKESAATSLWGATEGSRQDYMEQLYNQMAQLIQSGGVELYKEGDKKTIGENTYTFHNGEWILTIINDGTSGGSRGSGDTGGSGGSGGSRGSDDARGFRGSGGSRGSRGSGGSGSSGGSRGSGDTGGSGGSGDSGGNPPPTVPTDFSLEGEHEEGDTTEYEGVIYTWHNGQWVDPYGYPFGYAGPKPFN